MKLHTKYIAVLALLDAIGEQAAAVSGSVEQAQDAEVDATAEMSEAEHLNYISGALIPARAAVDQLVGLLTALETTAALNTK